MKDKDGLGTMIKVPDNLSIYLKSVAMEYSNNVVPLFSESIFRGEVFGDPENEDNVIVTFLGCDMNGHLLYIRFDIDVANNKVSYSKLAEKCLIDTKCARDLIKYVKHFIERLDIDKLPSISTVRLDLDVRTYRIVKYAKSSKEDDCIDLHICYYTDDTKDRYGFSEATNKAGILATF